MIETEMQTKNERRKKATNKQMNRDSYLISCDGNKFCFRK